MKLWMKITLIMLLVAGTFSLTAGMCNRGAGKMDEGLAMMEGVEKIVTKFHQVCSDDKSTVILASIVLQKMAEQGKVDSVVELQNLRDKIDDPALVNMASFALAHKLVEAGKQEEAVKVMHDIIDSSAKRMKEKKDQQK